MDRIALVGRRVPAVQAADTLGEVNIFIRQFAGLFFLDCFAL
jgi:hypothetical protein